MEGGVTLCLKVRRKRRARRDTQQAHAVTPPAVGTAVGTATDGPATDGKDTAAQREDPTTRKQCEVGHSSEMRDASIEQSGVGGDVRGDPMEEDNQSQAGRGNADTEETAGDVAGAGRDDVREGSGEGSVDRSVKSSRSPPEQAPGDASGSCPGEPSDSAVGKNEAGRGIAA